MTFPLYRLMLVVLVLAVALASGARANGILLPNLSDNSEYSEYWEQQFLFEDGTFATSQFLITNLPLSKHHGIEVGTLTGPAAAMFGGRVIIKNGRPRDGWSYDVPNKVLTIFSHRLEGQHPGYLMQLDNKAASLDVLYSAREDALPLTAPDDPLGLPAVTLYAPQAQAFARWRAGPELLGNDTTGDWVRLGDGNGFGMHVRQERELHTSVSRWLRITTLSGTKGRATPVLHQFTTPKGNTRTILYLLHPFSAPIRFDDPTLTEVKSGETWHLQAEGDGIKVDGIIKTERLLDRFILKDHLSGVEQLVAGASADIDRKQHLATLTLAVKREGSAHQVKGMAILEDIQIGNGQKKRNRRLR